MKNYIAWSITNNPNYQKPQEIKDFCRWVNMKATFKSCTWDEYKKRSIKSN